MKRMFLAAPALALVGGSLFATAGPSVAVTEHCPNFNSPDKVEVGYETTTVQLAPFSTVCYKAGTKVATVRVGYDGILRSTLTNKWGTPQAISYYIVTGGYSPY